MRPGLGYQAHVPNTSSTDENFTLVNSYKKSNNIKTSALFYFIQQMPEAELLSHLQPNITSIVKPTAERQAFLFKLEPNTVNSVYPNYTLYERHIRIDRYIQTANAKAEIKLFSYWHYTEYAKDQFDNHIKIHVYFNYGYKSPWLISIKHNDQKSTQLTEPKAIAQVNLNCLHAKEIVDRLLTKLSQHRRKIEQAFEKLIYKFDSVSYLTSLSENNLNQKIAECEKLHCEIANLNEDNPYHRFVLLKQAIAQAKTKEQPIDTKSLGTDIINNSLPIVKTKPIAPLVKSIDIIAFLRLRLSNLEQEYNNADLKSLIKLESKRIALYEDFMAQLFTANSKNTLGGLEAFDKKFKKLPTLLEKFTNYAMNSDIDNVKVLYKYVERELSTTFYTKLVVNIFTNLANKKLKQHILIWEYLFANNHACRIFIAALPNFFLIKGNKNQITIEYTIMMTLVLQDKKIFFDFMLDKLKTGNFVGIVIGANCYSLINSIAHIAMREYYVQALLNAGAYVEGFSADISATRDTALKEDEKEMAEIFRTSKQEDTCENEEQEARDHNFIIDVFNQFIPIGSTFFTYCFNIECQPSTLLALAKKSSIINLALGFTALSMNCYNVVVLTNNPQIYHLTKNDNDTNLLKEQLSNLDDDHHAKLFNFILKPSDDNFTNMQEIIKMLTIIVDKLNDQEIDRLISQILGIGKKYKDLNNFNLAIIAYNAAFFMVNHKTPSKETHQQIIKIFETLEQLHLKDTNSPMAEDGQTYAETYTRRIVRLRKISAFHLDLVPKAKLQL
jgi:hypothetical protein